MDNDSNTNDTNVSGLTPANESFDGISKLHPTSLQKSLVGINSLRPNASGVTSNASQAQPVPSTQAFNSAPATQADNPNSKGK